MNELERSVTLEGQQLDLTGAEFQLLKLLIGQPGEPLSRDELIPRVFGRESTGLDRSMPTRSSTSLSNCTIAPLYNDQTYLKIE